MSINTNMSVWTTIIYVADKKVFFFFDTNQFVSMPSTKFLKYFLL